MAYNVKNTFNVRDFGAVGNGIADDTTAIQNAINAAAVNGGTVFFPSGTYIISSTLNLASSIVLRGASRPKWNGPGVFQTGSWIKWGTPVTAGGTMLSGISVKDVIIENLGINGAEGGTTTQIVNGLQIQGAAGIGNASYNVVVRECIFIELDSCIIWGEGGVTGYQADTSSIERCELYDFTKYGIHLQSINAFDASKISQCTGVGVGSGGFFIYVEKAGFLTIEDSDGGNIGGGGGGFVKIDAATNPVTIKNCEVESSDYFLYVSGGSGDSSVINLYQCYTNNPIYIGTIARIISVGTLITGTLTLDHPGAKWMGFGDRVIVSLGGQVIINSGVFHNQDLTDAGQGSSSFHAAGQIIWAPDYWYGLSPGDGYGANKVAAEKCVRSGIRGAYWQANTSYPIGSIVVPSINNDHVYYSGGGTSGSVEPTWPLGSGSTVVSGTITFTEFGPSALFEPFGALNQLSGFAPPQTGYYTEGAISFNTTPHINNIFAWVCTISGNPGTWKALFISNDPGYLTQTDWYVDWVNGNDGYAGTISAPVKTVMGGVVPKWGTNEPKLSQTTTLHIITPQPANVEEIILAPQLIGEVNFIIKGTPQLVATFNMGTVTAKARATNTQFQSTGFSAGGLAVGQLVHNNTGGKDSWCFIRTLVGGTAKLTQPLAPLVAGIDTLYFATPAEIDTWANGESVSVYNPCKLNLRSIVATGGGNSDGSVTTPGVWMEYIEVIDGSGVAGTSTFAPQFSGNYILMQSCVIDAYVDTLAASTFQITLTNCYLNGISASMTYIIGGICTTFAIITCDFNWLDADFIIDDGGGLSGEVSIGVVQFYSTTACHGNAEVRIVNGSSYGAVLWGTGTINVQAGSLLWNTSGTTWVNSFYATLQLKGAVTGTRYNSATGIWTSGIALTAANLDGYIGLQDPISGARAASQ